MKKVIFFDLDNTLLDRQTQARKLYTRIIELEVKENITSIVDDLMILDNKGKNSRDLVFSYYIDKYKFAKHTVDIYQKMWEEMLNEEIQIFEDAHEVIEKLSAKYRLGIITNGQVATQQIKINALPFLNKFEMTLIAAEIDIWKPDPGIFYEACRRMGTTVEESIYIGDTYEIDCIGAKNAHMKSILIDRENNYTDIEETRVNCLIELLDIL